MRFEDLPITLDDIEVMEGGWRRPTVRESTVAELLEIWSDWDEGCTQAMSQVLRHLRDQCTENAKLREENQTLRMILQGIHHTATYPPYGHLAALASIRKQSLVESKSPHGISEKGN